jgi:hypothetical protein
MKTIVESSAHETYNDYFQIHKVTLIGSLLAKILCLSYTLYNKKKAYKKHNKNCIGTMS